MKLTLLALSILLIVSLSCTKHSDSMHDVSLGLKETMDSPSMNGPNGCYHTFFETLRNPPAGYIPGSAYLDLDDCLGPYMPNGTTGGKRHWPPPTPAPGDRTLMPPDNTTEDGVFKDFWNWSQTSAVEISSKSALYHSIIAAAFAENGGIPELNIDKQNLSLYYLGNHQTLYPTVDLEHFAKYLDFFYSYASLGLSTDFLGLNGLAWGAQAQSDFLDSGGVIRIVFHSPFDPFRK